MEKLREFVQGGHAAIPEQHLMMRFDIRGTDTDYHDRLHLFSLFSYLQEIAYFHAHDLNIGAKDLDDKALVWILVRTSVRMLEMPRWGQQLTIKTWQRGVKRLTFIRDFLLIDENEAVLGYASSEWILADLKTHRPARPDRVLPPELIPPLQPPVFNLDVPRLADFARPDQDNPVIRRYADYSDIDRNHHVNNTRYAAWSADALAAMLARQQQVVTNRSLFQSLEFDIQFVSEVIYGEKINLFVDLASASSAEPAASNNLAGKVDQENISAEYSDSKAENTCAAMIQGVCEADNRTVFRSRLVLNG